MRVSRLLRLALAAIALLALLARVARPSEAQAGPTAAAGITYPQLSRLAITVVLLAFGLWVAVWFVSRTQEVLTIFLISVILAVALRPSVDDVSRRQLPLLHRPVPRAVAILVIYLLLALIVALVMILIVPRLAVEVSNLIGSLPGYLMMLQGLLSRLEEYPFVADLSTLQQQAVNQIIASFGQITAFLSFAIDLVTTILSFGVVLVLTFFLIMDAEPLHRYIISLLPPEHRGRAREVTGRMGRKIEGWLTGEMTLSVFIGGGTALGMWLLDMPFPLLLGLAAGLFELVPMVGAYLGATPAVIVALFQPTWKLIAVIAFFVMLQQIENNILAPNVMSRQVEMPPLLVILALLMGAAIMGIVGALLAVPVAAVLQVLWTDVVVPGIRRRQRE